MTSNTDQMVGVNVQCAWNGVSGKIDDMGPIPETIRSPLIARSDQIVPLTRGVTIRSHSRNDPITSRTDPIMIRRDPAED